MSSRKKSNSGRQPAGDSAGVASAEEIGPRPRWPLILAAVVYAGWVVFLLAMAYLRVRETTRM